MSTPDIERCGERYDGDDDACAWHCDKPHGHEGAHRYLTPDGDGLYWPARLDPTDPLYFQRRALQGFELAGRNPAQPAKCPKAGLPWAHGSARAPHVCPYAHEIHNDTATLCTCCERCEHECRMDV